jgi:hypothetical protein
MRELTINLGGEELLLVADFKASLEISNKIGDPLLIAREAFVEQMLLARGMAYEPKWSFTVENIPRLLHIGLVAAKSSMKIDRVQELVFEEGFAASRDHALNYLTLIIGPKAEEKIEDITTEGTKTTGE